jgi:hypothetical protein
MCAALGSFIGLVAGGVTGGALADMERGSTKEKAGTIVIATILGTALGAFAGAALSSPSQNTTTTITTTGA